MADRRSVEIIDTIFRSRADRPRRRTALAAAVVLAIYGGAALLTLSMKASLSSGNAGLAARMETALAKDRAVEMLPPPPPAKLPPVAEKPAVSQPLARPAGRVPRRAARVAPAQAAAVSTRAAPESPLDLTSNGFASGEAASFPGGATAGAGSSTTPVAGTVDVHAPATDRPALAKSSVARPVALATGTWVCPWPGEADAEQIDQQTVVIRVRVGADGTVDAAQLVADPGNGFGHAAMACARQTRFEPARDDGGNPIASWSPPIRVHFWR